MTKLSTRIDKEMLRNHIMELVVSYGIRLIKNDASDIPVNFSETNKKLNKLLKI